MSSIGAGAPVGRRTAADEGRCTAGADDGTVPVPRVTVGEVHAPCGIKKRTLQRVTQFIIFRKTMKMLKQDSLLNLKLHSKKGTLHQEHPTQSEPHALLPLGPGRRPTHPFAQINQDWHPPLEHLAARTEEDGGAAVAVDAAS